MAKRVIMPALGIAQETGLIIEWLKNEGDAISAGEPLLEIETDKATAVLEAEASGILAHVTASAGEEIPIAQTIAWILAPGERLPAEAETRPVSTSATPTTTPVMATPLAGRIAQEHGVDLSLVNPAGGKITKNDVLAYLQAEETTIQPGAKLASQTQRAKLLPASPKARRLAAEKGVDLKRIPGSGPDGAVLAADVLAFRPVSPAPLEIQEKPEQPAPPGAGRAWLVMAQRLTESWNTVPHIYLARDVDASAFRDWYQVAQKRAAEKITYTDLLIKVCAAALREHPRVNASWIDGDISYHEAINIGLAVAVEDGLLVPVLHDADNLTIPEIAEARKGLVSRAQAGKLKITDLQGGTFTISNLGMFGIDAFNAIVNPPEAAILAVGRLADRVVPYAGEVQVRPMMTLTLSLDHRVVDGARGAQFLTTLASFIEEPLSIL